MNEKLPEASPRDSIAQRAAIDRSFRSPVLFFVSNALLWLIFATVFGFIASRKLLVPDFLGHAAWLSYGRIHPAFFNALIYGWAFQVGFGVALWLLGRLCRVELRNPKTLVTAGVLWNIGVTIGVLGIFFGGNTSLEWLEFPAYVWPILLVAYSMIGAWAFVLFRSRTVARDQLFVSVWYIVAALFWFPWMAITAQVVLHYVPTAAVIKAGVNAWYVHGLVNLWLVPLGLAAAYYFIPKIVGRKIFSYRLASFGFWTLAFLSGWVGYNAFLGGPFPSWMITAGAAATMLMLIPVAAVALNHHKTTQGYHFLLHFSPTLRFTVFGAVTYTVMSAVLVLPSLNTVGKLTQFTHFTEGMQLIAIYGFFSMLMFGAIYFMVPRLVGQEWRSAKLVRAHFWLSAYGILTMVGVMTLAGLSQGGALNRWDASFWASVANSRPYLVGRSLAWGLLVSSHVIFAINFTTMLIRHGRRGDKPTLLNEKLYEELHSEPTKLGEVKA